MMSALMASLLGFTVGLRHAFEPDHLAALSALATEREKGRTSGAWLGAAWGLGHALSLLVVAGTLAIFEAAMPAQFSALLEGVVGLVIVGLGVRAVLQSFRAGGSGAVLSHSHGGIHHAHATSADHIHVSRWALATRPLLVGVLHGLAGSGALTALVIAELPTLSARLIYIAVFSAGSVAGMALLTGVARKPLLALLERPKTGAWLLRAVGAMSCGIGAWWATKAAHEVFQSVT